MTEDEAQTAAEFINDDWGEHRNPATTFATSAVPGGPVTVDPAYAHADRVPYWPHGEPRPVVSDEHRWKRTRFLHATAIERSLLVAFQWPSDDPGARTYLLIVDVAGWSVDDQLTSSVVWSKLDQLLAVPEWTTTRCLGLTERLSIVLPPDAHS